MPAELCFLCGVAARTETINTAPDKAKSGPHFPWLGSIHAAPGAAPPCPKTGSVQACLLCVRLLTEQWKLHEKRRVPQASRQYWTKAWSYCSVGGFSRESGSFAELEPGETAPPTAEDTCVLCTQSCGSQCKFVSLTLLARIPEFSKVASSLTSPEVAVCAKCFQSDPFQKGVKQALAQPESAAAPNLEQAMFLYQLLLQNAMASNDPILKANLLAALATQDPSLAANLPAESSKRKSTESKEQPTPAKICKTEKE